MESQPVRRHVGMESALTPLAFHKNPSTAMQCPGRPAGRRALGDTNPNQMPDRCDVLVPEPIAAAKARTPLNIFAPDNGQPTPRDRVEASPVNDTGRRLRGAGYHNLESNTNADREFPSKGIRRVEVPEHHAHVSGVRLVDTPNSSRFRNIAILGSDINDSYYLTPANAHSSSSTPGGPAVSVPRRRPQSASAPIADLFRMDKTFGSTNPDDWGCPNASPHKLPPQVHDLSRLERARLAICDHVQQRHGSLSNFYFSLSRGVVGRLDGLEQAREGLVPITAMREQLAAAISIPLGEGDLSRLVFRAFYEIEGGTEAEAPKFVSYRDFAVAFADGPRKSMLRAHKI